MTHIPSPPLQPKLCAPFLADPRAAAPQLSQHSGKYPAFFAPLCGAVEVTLSSGPYSPTCYIAPLPADTCLCYSEPRCQVTCPSGELTGGPGCSGCTTKSIVLRGPAQEEEEEEQEGTAPSAHNAAQPPNVATPGGGMNSRGPRLTHHPYLEGDFRGDGQMF